MPKPYHITKYTYRRAKQIGVKVKQSTSPTKKIDVYRKNKKIASVGFRGMNDFPTYIISRGRKYAQSRRKAFKTRFEKDRHVKWSRTWLSDQLLW